MDLGFIGWWSDMRDMTEERGFLQLAWDDYNLPEERRGVSPAAERLT